MPDWKKLIEGKIALAKKGLKRNEPNQNERIPSGQTLTTKFPILDISLISTATSEFLYVTIATGQVAECRWI